ncbi:hypothetical protein BKA63DRAFT_483297 [Paraphoma chrysanthemicola]|nr:hypothetical protein BKA63DRAFT_483297 [Paraphoma chrysanthemicola]
MLSNSDVLQKHFNTSSHEEASKIFQSNACLKFPLASWTKMQLPYLAPNHPELPSFEHILQAMKTNQYPHCPVCQIGDFIVKAGRDGHIVQEAENLLYLRANSSLRLPTLHAVLTAEDEHGTVYYMVMSRVPGFALSPEKWLTLPSTARTQILSSLSEQVRVMRAIPAPGYYGHVHKQGWRPTLGAVAQRFDGMCGPYETYTEFARAVDEESAEDWEATLIDWADAGWWPAWMQAVTLHETMNMCTRIEGSMEVAVNKEAAVEIIESLLPAEDRFEEYVKMSEDLYYYTCHTLAM